jgi:cobalt-zinc-cadmium efflux system membrane fusion protein
VTLPDGQVPGASVPARAVLLRGDKHYVFVEEQPGQFAQREVQLGAEQNGRVLVLAGVQLGQRVVTDGCILLQQLLK